MIRFIFYFLFLSSIVWGQVDPNSLIPPTSGVTADGGGESSGSTSATTGFFNKNKYTYDENEGRDPFRPYRDPTQPIITSQPKPTSADKPVPPEERRTLATAIIPDDISLVGIMYSPPSSVAMFTVNGAPGFYRLKRGGPIGRNEGKVVNIQKDSVEIEQVKNFDGQKVPEKITLKLRNKKN